MFESFVLSPKFNDICWGYFSRCDFKITSSRPTKVADIFTYLSRHLKEIPTPLWCF